MVVPVARGVAAPALLLLLADGRLHSGEGLALQLGVSRAAVWKGIERLRVRGIDVEALPRRGYRLPHAVEFLERGRIEAGIDAVRLPRLASLDVRFEVDSTNTRLLAAAPPPPGQAQVLLCELQQAGRGRRGRPWLAPFGGGIAVSIAWSFSDVSKASPALSLGVGVAVARALARAGAAGIALKWPNDIWFETRKLGGVLLELRAEASGPAHVVIGVGINVTLAPAARQAIERLGVRAAAVADACSRPPSRNFIAGAIIDELLSMLVDFERRGFESVRAAWESLDALADQPARVLTGGTLVCGTARGIDEHGALRLEREGRLEKFVSGEVSLRPGGDAI